MTEPIRGEKWRRTCQIAFLESDPAELTQKLFAAETAIFVWLQELAADCDDHTSERHDIERAVSTLRRLQVEKLNYPRIKVLP